MWQKIVAPLGPIIFSFPDPTPLPIHTGAIPVAHYFPSCPLSIPKISSPPPPCPHPCWLSRRPCCRAATSFRSLDAPPPPRDAPQPVVHFYSRLPLVRRLVVMSHLVAPPPPHVTFRRAPASRVHPLPPRLHSHRLVVASHLVALPTLPILSSTPPPLNAVPPHIADCCLCPATTVSCRCCC